jgi:hypothetical protein
MSSSTNKSKTPASSAKKTPANNTEVAAFQTVSTQLENYCFNQGSRSHDAAERESWSRMALGISVIARHPEMLTKYLTLTRTETPVVETPTPTPAPAPKTKAAGGGR